MPPVPSRAPRGGGLPTRLLAAAVTISALLAAALGATGSPASATTPPGAQVEVFFAQDPDYTTHVQQGTFNSTLFAIPAGGVYTPRVNNCPSGTRVAFAFTPASTTPGTAGSPERPQVTAGATVEDLFTWPAPDSPGTAMAFQMNPRNLVGPADDLVSIDTRWPAGTLVSLVSVCYSGKSLIPAEEPVVADPSGNAITSWLQFTTVASTTNPALTSAGFRAGIKTSPTVTLTGTQADGNETMTAWVTDAVGAALPSATGSIEFYSGARSQRTLTRTVPLDSSSSASITVPVPAPGSQTVYDATYVPDSAAAGTYNSATSARHAVVGAPIVVAPEVALSVRPTIVGAAAEAVVTARRQGASASGSVALLVDGQPWRTVPLLAGRAAIDLSDGLLAGDHAVEADYSGDSSTLPGRATATVSVRKQSGSVRAKARVIRAESARPEVALKVTVKRPTEGSVDPTGTVAVSRHGKILGRAELSPQGSAVIHFARPAKLRHGRLDVAISYSGDSVFLPMKTSTSLRLHPTHAHTDAESSAGATP